MANLWEKSPLNKHCEITSSKRIFSADYLSEGVPFYRGKEITEKHKGSLNVSTEIFISKSKFLEIKNKFGAPKPGDLLLTSVGTLGMPYVVKQGEEFYFKDGNLTWFRNFKDLDSRFIYYWLLSPQGKGELKKATIGSSQSAYTIVLLKEMEVALPPLETQLKIVSILSAYDDLIENNTRRIKILEEMARMLYREWFVNFRFPGHEQVKMVDSPLGLIPEGWGVKVLEELVDEHIGGGWGKEEPEEKFTEPAWVIRGTDIPDARYCQTKGVPFRYHTRSNLRTRKLEVGDIIFEVSGGSKGQPVGRSLLFTKQLQSAFAGDAVICASFCKRVKPKNKTYYSEILYLSFVEGYTSGEIEEYQVQSTGISNFKWTEYLQQTQRVVPPQEMQERFCNVASPMFAHIATLGLKSANLRKTRDLLLPKLISGEIEV